MSSVCCWRSRKMLIVKILLQKLVYKRAIAFKFERLRVNGTKALKWWEDAVQEERREMAENLVIVRFGSLDEELSSAIALMLQLPTEELTRLLLTLSREELLERFGGGSN
ncbi:MULTISPECIES: hypothetical protein [Cyanophyceae]|uniref:hypothetical protein n=1 Tax=Cyanophyceae TaxID=3028117 RepID=UPI001683637E|nr:hypothetical protein [Trichocoleus sp. FACHB-69]MBD1935714.1 hypothetical protein [Trichocoleus sp. FACHB-69]